MKINLQNIEKYENCVNFKKIANYGKSKRQEFKKETEKKREVSQESSQLWKRHIEILTEKWPAETEAVLEGSAFVSVPEGGCFTSC